MIRAVNGRWGRLYLGPPSPRDCYVAVTYHRRVRGKLRQLTISDRLMAQVLR